MYLDSRRFFKLVDRRWRRGTVRGKICSPGTAWTLLVAPRKGKESDMHRYALGFALKMHGTCMKIH